MPRTRVERRVLVIAMIVAVGILALGATAFARGSAPATSTVLPSAKKPATPAASKTASGAVTTSGTVVVTKGGYALDFTLPTYGKSGCLVCHGDPSLVVAKGDSTHSYWIDERQYRHSAHAGVICTGCHVDYGYKAPHGQPGADWRAVAKQSCKNCHPAQFDEVSQGAHAIRPRSGEPDPKAAQKPLCGDCHGGHDMPVTKQNPAGKAELHAKSQEMCGRSGCHPDYWANYEDYYHGAAYKRGAHDAPACWDCHGRHQMLRSSDRFAPTNSTDHPENLKTACATGSCHNSEAGVQMLESYIPLIHGRSKAVQKNPAYSLMSGIMGRFKR